MNNKIKMVFVPPHPDALDGWLSKLTTAFPEVTFATPQSAAEAIVELGDADAAFGTLTAELLNAAKRLQWLQAPAAAPAAGFYFDELIAHDVRVTNFRGIYNDHISYQILGYMLSFTKHLHEYRDQQREKLWQPLKGPRYNTIYLPESTLLIVGVGGIGLETARLCKAIGMRVVGTDVRLKNKPDCLDELYGAEALSEVAAQADFVVTTVPHTPSTEGIFDAAFFERMKNSAIFINIGRGMTTRLDDLNSALRSGSIAGAALDVFETEPLPSAHPLWDAPNVLITPHVAVLEAAHLDQRRYDIIEHNVRRFLSGEELMNTVDKASWF